VSALFGLRVKAAVEEVFDNALPKTYARDLFQQKCNRVFELIYEYASKGLKWAA
jgi:type I restriction enzyme R subunit